MNDFARHRGTPQVRVLGPGAHVASYLITREIAVGGMATVYEATHAILPRRVALKVMHADLVPRPGAAERLYQEACILESLQHPGVVRLYEVGLLADRRPWLAMELVDATPLSSQFAGGPLLVHDVTELIVQIADVLAFAHARGIVHRDLKPENILVGPNQKPRLVDWGIARSSAGRLRITVENATPGTPTYMSPEQLRGSGVDGRADVYALGVVAYEALTGAPPFPATEPMAVALQHLQMEPVPVRQRRPDVPEELGDLIERMLMKDPDRRPTARQIQRDASGLPVIVDDAPYEELVLAETPVPASRQISPRASCDQVHGELEIVG